MTLWLLAVSLLLSACSTVVSSGCPRLVEYTEAEQARAANELLQLPDDAVLGKMIADYGVVRAETRVCREGV